MSLFTAPERQLAEAVSALQDTNPFLPERIAWERRALGADYVGDDGGAGDTEIWHRSEDLAVRNRNLDLLEERVEELALRARRHLRNHGLSGVVRDELDLYEDLILYHTYYRQERRFLELIDTPGAATQPVRFYDEYRRDVFSFLGSDVLPVDRPGGSIPDPAHLFALAFQVRRAFHHAFRFILGGSMPAARLRAAVWQSIFTHDMRRYRRVLYGRMNEITTLITGPSGTGKELVAQAVGRSRYVPFDDSRASFLDDPSTSFYALNLSALSPTLIESELFGHCKGSFTGAHADRAGFLEICSEHGTVFLDEIGEVDPAIQVKLLRLLQTRTYQRLGETRERQFRGKVIAATNRDLDREMAEGRFREDFYYRLCADRIETPALAAQLADSTAELRRLIELLAERMVGEDEAPAVADETLSWIRKGLPADYAWPGNVRELEQCVRNVLIRSVYHPPRQTEDDDPAARLARQLDAGALTAEELIGEYCTLVHLRTGSYSETGRRLGLDRRTVKAKIEGLEAGATAGDAAPAD